MLRQCLTPCHVRTIETVETSSSRVCDIRITDLTSHHVISVPLVHLKGHYRVGDLAVMNLWMWIREQPKTFFSDGIRNVVDCYKNVELQGDYAEK